MAPLSEEELETSGEPRDEKTPGSGPAVTLRFAYARDDLAHAMRVNFASQTAVRFNAFMAVCLVALGLWLVGDPKSGLLALTCLLVGGVFIALVAMTWFFGADIAIRREPKYRESYDLAYTDAGVTFKSQPAKMNSRRSCVPNIVSSP